MVRLPGCLRTTDTTVLAHIRSVLTSGMGLKPHDLLGAWACHHCHDVVDKRIGGMDTEFVRLAHLEGMYRTLAHILTEYDVVLVEK